jgi:hypothetical protein
VKNGLDELQKFYLVALGVGAVWAVACWAFYYVVLDRSDGWWIPAVAGQWLFVVIAVTAAFARVTRR